MIQTSKIYYIPIIFSSLYRSVSSCFSFSLVFPHNPLLSHPSLLRQRIELRPSHERYKKNQVEIFFWDVDEQKLIPTPRAVSTKNIEQNALNALYKGPNSSESSLTLLACASTGAQILSIEQGLAKVQLQGDCSGCGSMSIYDSIVATLKKLPSVKIVHVLDPQGNTQSDGDHVNARPACLNP